MRTRISVCVDEDRWGDVNKTYKALHRRCSCTKEKWNRFVTKSPLRVQIYDWTASRLAFSVCMAPIGSISYSPNPPPPPTPNTSIYNYPLFFSFSSFSSAKFLHFLQFVPLNSMNFLLPHSFFRWIISSIENAHNDADWHNEKGRNHWHCFIKENSKNRWHFYGCRWCVY